MAGRTVSLKVRFADFTTITRSRTLPEATDVAAVVYGTARGLFESLGLDRARLRLVGVRVEQLVRSETAPHQLLLGERSRGRREAEQAADRAALRFGSGAVRPASLVPERTERTDRPDDASPGANGKQPLRPPGRSPG
jgi:DNA polymerase-4